MDKISDFSKELRERISSPFFFSFIVAWLIFNWKLWVGLFFYSNAELKVDGYNSYIDFVSKNLTGINTIWKPASVALAYTFIFPFFRNCIIAFHSWIKAWGNSWSLSLSKTSKISISKYVELREIYQARTSLLQEVLDKEGAYLKEYEEEKNKVLKLTSDKNEAFNELQKWKSLNDSTQLNGDWEIRYLDDERSDIYRVRITNNIMEFLDSPPSDKNAQTLIRSFFRSPHATFLTLVTVFEDETRKRSYHFFQLDILDDMKILRGVEDDRKKIEFRKSR